MFRLSRTRLLATCVIALAACLGALLVHPSPLLAYVGIVLLCLAVVAYMLPSRETEEHLRFSRRHPFNRFLTTLNLVTLPLTFAFVMVGLYAMIRSDLLLLLLLLVLRIAPGWVIARAVFLRRKRLMDATPVTEGLSDVGASSMCKVRGFIHQTRTRRVRFGKILYNAWITDGSLTKIFITGLTEIKGITEKVREGSRCTVVGPSTVHSSIVAIQPVASLVLPTAFHGTEAEWMEVIWRRTRNRRVMTSGSSSVIYLLAILVLHQVVVNLSPALGELMAAGLVALLAAVFFAALTEKAARESETYGVGNYFEPQWEGATKEARLRRLERLRQQAELGLIPHEYLGLVEAGEGRSG